MSNHNKTSSEQNFQDRFIKKLISYRWSAPDSLNGNKLKVTVDTLINNWRAELNRLNAAQLEGVELSDSEFKQVLSKVSQIDNSFEAAKILAMEGSTGKIDGIYRDKHPQVTKDQITLTIFGKAQVSGGSSNYQVAREVETSNGNRFDIVLLINGLPLINIEQKRADKSLDEAYGQFIRYYRDGEYINNFMAFSQMMVVMSEIATRYFATPKSINAFNKSFVFQWADKDNRPINDWEEVVETLLMIPMAHQLVGDYLIIDEALEEENRKHMIMRPYQVYALQAIEAAAFGFDNEDKIPHGGYVWHTTGSGKTITSFKTALFLSTRAGFDKVVFLVDRRSLDTKTSENFKAYAAYESVSVDDTKHTYHLRRKLLSGKRGIIVTTTFKLDSLIKDLVDNDDYDLANKKIVFIIDEAHRTTMGKMMVNIREYFKRNSLFYGFTGTPLFDENKATGMINHKSEVIDTTEKLFGPELHKYTIDQAIADGNVLGFHVDFINTGEFLNHDQLREDIKEEMLEEETDLIERDIERELRLLSDAEIEYEAKKRGILIYSDETHIPRVVEDILANWEVQSKSKNFNAILTVAYKERVLDYYDAFMEALKDSEYKINVAMTFSFGNENDFEGIPLDKIETMFEDYEKFTGIKYIYDGSGQGEDNYFEDLVTRSTRGGSGRNLRNIDLVIVAEQLLTGYDSKYLNTLYVDRSLKLQGLIQAYSRTNRVYGRDKEFGTIINYQYPKITEELVNKALILYGSGGKSSRAIVEQYDVAVSKLAVAVDEMLGSLADPTTWKELETNDILKEKFISSYTKASARLATVYQYYEFNWDNKMFGLSEHEWLRYTGAYKNLRSDEDILEEEVLPIPLRGKTKLSGSQIIDADHILKLIGSTVTHDKGIQTVDSETLRLIHQEIQELSNLGNDSEATLLKEFVDTELVTGKLSSDFSFDELFNNWKKQLVKKDVKSFAKKWGIDSSLLMKSLERYTLSRKDVIPYIDDLRQSLNYDIAENKELGSKLRHTILFINEELPEYLIKTKKKFK